MAPAYYIYKYPYKLGWYLAKIFGKQKGLVFYCADPLDYELFQPIKKYLPDVELVAKNKKTRNFFSQKGIKYLRLPVFPKIVIMARLSPHKFPVEQITKIGFGHGLYQFKQWTSNENFNRFNVYFLTSEAHVKAAEARGITTTKAIGFPKLDDAFNGTYNNDFLNKIKKEINIDENKKTIIFTSTWNLEQLSALDRWIDRIEELTEKYNILITVHTWIEKSKIDKLKSIKGAYFIDSFNAIPYLMIADVFVGDYSSIIGEACALDKPIITFRVPESKRSMKEIHELIKNTSIQIDEFDEIHSAIERCLNNPDEKKVERQATNKILFLALDGKAGKRVAEEINNLIKSNNS